jgi:hypothetical protein
MKYRYKIPPVVTIISRKENTVSSEGKMIPGVVSYRNHVGSTCIMTSDQFDAVFEKIKENSDC